MQLTEGESYTVRVTVTNRSTRGGEPCEADLDVGVQAFSTYHTLISATRRTQHFDAAQSLAFAYPMAVPLGSGGETGSIAARVFDPADNVLADAGEPITIEVIAAEMVTISLKNPPAGAKWQLILYDWNETENISISDLGIGEVAIFNIPPEWKWPLRIDILVYNPITFATYCRLHSTSDSFPQYYTDIFIPEPGEYPFNMATNQLEGVVIEPPGFTLGVTAVPGNVVWWQAQLDSLYPQYPEITKSRPFGVTGRWLCPSAPTGRVARLWGLDAEYETVMDVRRIDPLYSGRNYTYNCSTGEVPPPPPPPPEPVCTIGDSKYVGYDLYICIGDESVPGGAIWHRVTAPPPPEPICTLGDTKYIDGEPYVCVGDVSVPGGAKWIPYYYY